VSLIDWFDGALLRGSALDWFLRPDRIHTRLTGIIPSPNGVASLVIVAVGVYAAALAFARDVRIRAIALVALPILALTLYFTYSRAALLGIFAIAVIVAWKIRRPIGIALLAVGIVAGALLLPTYLASRAGALGGEGTVDPSGVFVASDAHRLRAWQSASQMFLDAPLTGHGFLAYRDLHELYDDPVLRSPHNEWLRLFAEEGILVGLAGLAFLVTTFVTLWRGSGWIVIGALAGFTGWAIAATFNNPFLFIQVSVIAFTVVGTGLSLARSQPDVLSAESEQTGARS
jgi:O-antigen ligase